MKVCMLSDIRRRNGLGDPPKWYTNNDSEAMNKKFKNWQSHKAVDLPTFTDDVKAFVQQDHEIVQAAFASDGEYKFCGSFQQFAIGSKWYAMSMQQKKEHQKNFIKFTASYPLATPSTQPTLLQSDKKATAGPMEGIVAKAKNIIANKSIANVPGNLNQAVVSSSTSQDPRIVTKKTPKASGIEIACGPGRGCLGYATYKVCAHCQAAAVFWGVEEQYHQWILSSAKTGINLHALSKYGLPDGAGKKENQKQKRTKRRTQKSLAASTTQVASHNDTFTTQTDTSGTTANAGHPAYTTHGGNSGSFRMPTVGHPAYTTHGSNSGSLMPTAGHPPYTTHGVNSGSFRMPTAGHAATVTHAATSGSFGIANASHPAHATLASNANRNQPNSFLGMINSFQQPTVHYAAMPPDVSESFYLTFLEEHPRVQKCCGCRRPFRRDVGAPYDIIISHKEFREYKDKDGITQCPLEKKPAYYHVNKECISRRNANFQSTTDLVIEPKIMMNLCQGHFNFLEQHIDYIF